MISLGVENLEKALAFYEKGLKLPRVPTPPEVAFFQMEGSWLALASRADLAADAGVPPEGQGFRGIALAHNVSSES